MPSDQFIEWIEEGLVRHGVGKVIPPAGIVEHRARQIIGLQMVWREAAELDAEARGNAAAAELPANLAESIRAEFSRDPTLPWEDALARALAAR